MALKVSKNKQWQWHTLSLKLLLMLFVMGVQVNCEVLTPPYFNLAENRRITATATCGEDGPELYCKLVGANADTADTNIYSHIVIQGQVCDHCDNGKEGKAHPAQYAIDGSERWWQSPPLSRGMKYNEVNLTIDLGQEFHVAYVFIVMANSPRPGVWVLERSIDDGKTFRPWQYFADTPADCEKFFGAESLQGIVRDDSVVCDTTYSKVVPLEGGEIVVSLLNNRPNSGDFFGSPVLQEWTRATNIRLRLLRTKTLLGHLMSVARQDHTVTRRYFYSIKDISIGGRCRCNGHADLCDITDPEDAYKLLCRCQHHTCGAQCESCCPGYVQKAWRPATYTAPFSCEPCNCFGHSYDCYYDEQVDRNRTSIDMDGKYEGGGVCINCRDNTEGINCHSCRSGYFRPYGKSLNASDVCHPCQCDFFYSTGNCEEGSGRCECRPEFQGPNCDSCSSGYYDYPNCKPCDCHINGTRGEICEVGGGQCPCKLNFAGKNCDKCAEGFWNDGNGCQSCECEDLGSVSPVCDPDDGQCECDNRFAGRQCNQCEDGYWNYADKCQYCSCDVRGTREGICSKETGVCLCAVGYSGARCDQCLASYYGYPDCRPCNCSAVGSATTVCDATGKCPCLPNFSGRTCDQCTPGYYQYPECDSCECSSDGSMGVSCDDEGKCQCKVNFDGLKCTSCREGFYIFPNCEECNCDPAGVIETFSGCGDSPAGELCECKQRVEGRICNDCKPLFWNLQQYNPLGCDDCNCNIPGVLGGVEICDGKTGQCTCKPNVMSRRCEQCRDGYFNLTAENLLGCNDCGCDVGGSGSDVCDKASGQCACRPRITGQKCTKPLQTHYFPTLHQFQHEAEDGRTPVGGPVRFGYDDDLFPDYSWRGYAIYSQLQPQTNHELYVEKSSLYRVVIRYINPGEQTIVGEIIASPDNPNDAEFRYKVRYEPKPLRSPSFLTVSQAGNIPAPFVLNPGRWQFSFKNDQYLLVDYFVLLPEAYYEGSILQKRVSEPCLLNTTNTRGKSNIIVPDPCILLRYPSLQKFDSVSGIESYITEDGSKSDPSQFYRDPKTLQTLKMPADRMVLLSPQQRRLELDMGVTKGGRYALVLEYFTPNGANITKINVESTSKKGMTKGHALIYDCKHATPCRQVMTTKDGEVAVFRFDQSSINIKLEVPNDIEDRIAIHSITAVPLGKWSLDHIKPKEYCVVKNGSCIESSYELPPDSVKVEAESSEPDRIVDEENLPVGVTDKNLILLDGKDRTLEISGKVSNPGYYTFLVHYHQPDNPDFILEVLIKNGQHYEARVPIIHCPSTAGCRSQITQDDKNSRFYIDENFDLTLKSPKSVLIDYIVAVPAPYDNQREVDRFLEQTPLDETRRFIAECGKNHMYLPTNTSEFCRNAVFSLTSEYNNGALRCHCDVDGSYSFECEEFGGQCQCKEYVIGRRCERCRTNFFGFPDCQPCDCPSTALCDPNNGVCVCPAHVTGERCDKCEPFTFGFDPLIGCEECACSALGVEGGNLQCDLFTGHCQCRQNVIGRTCSQCVAGTWSFPFCQLCDCDLRGTVRETICNQDNAECYCKINVEGRGCDTCKVGSFYLDEQNPSGCTKCFCFGKTARCSSSALYWTQITAGKSQITSVMFDPSRNMLVKEIGFEIEFEGASSEETEFIPVYIPEGTIPSSNESSVMYFRVAMSANHLASYGGKLTFNLVSEPDDDQARESYVGPDVILEGRELAPSSNIIRLMHYAIDHLDGEHSMKMSLSVKEDNFVVFSPTGGVVPATRDQLMIVLKELRAVYVRATYWKQTREVKLSSFGLEIGSGEFSSHEDRALSVELCQCPPNYQGLSCEECAQGYYRSPAGPFGGFCVPCQCNGHSETCDPVSGVCLDCHHHTSGDHCEKCEVGYHGDATIGTPYDCLICACPLPVKSNNFATSCELSPDGLEISCECRSNAYIGQRCEACGPGYYGQPEIQGDYCKPCECSGNIDVSNPQSCDTVTGRCLQCLNNTGGPACNLCARGYYGDAIDAKDCRSCDCNECGTNECDSTTGDCRPCLSGVVGEKCDRCRPDYYGLSRCDGTGCHYCDCAIAAESTQCDDLSGQCECKKGTTGRRCDRCAPGFWNYTEHGCQACECNQDYAIGVGCDPETGQCSCLPGVIGEKCSHCPHRWVLNENYGCQPCESCHHQLLDDTDRMAEILDPVKADFDSVAVSYFTTQKLTYFNDTAARLEPEVKLLDPSRVELNPYYTAIEMLEQDSKLSKQRVDVSGESLREKVRLSSKLRDKSFEVESKVQEAVAKARQAVFETKDLMEGLLAEEKYSSPQTDSAMAEAQAIIDTMSNVEFNSDDAMQEQKNADKVLREIKEYVAPVKILTTDIKEETGKISNIKDKLRDIRNQSDYAIQTAQKANDISNQIKEAKSPAKVHLLELRSQEMVNNSESAAAANLATQPIVEDLENFLLQLDAVTIRVKDVNEPLARNVETLQEELENNRDTIRQSQEHVRKLRQEADELDSMLGDTRIASTNAVSAATSYQKIADALEEARMKALEAKLNAENATTMTSGVEGLAIVAREPSSNLLKMARQSVVNVEQELNIPLQDAKYSMQEIETNNTETKAALNSIDKDLGRIDILADTVDIENSIGSSTEGIEKANDALESVEEIVNNIERDNTLSRALPITVNDLNEGVGISDSQLKQAKESIPLSEAITGNLESKKPILEDKKADLGTKLAELKAKIATAREQANRVPVGMNLDQTGYLLLANPQSLGSQQTHTKLSTYFKTSEPEGLILYLGNEAGRKGEEDFLAIEVDQGNPVLTMDLGSGPQSIRIAKYVADNQWYKATVNRAGKTVQFTVSEEDQLGQTKDYVSEGYIQGPKSLFNVDRNSSRLYVGGLPPGGDVKSPVRYTSYRGTIEDLTIGDEKIGLWNFKDGQNLAPALERDRFVDLRPQTGLRFQGNGYAVIDGMRMFQFREKSFVRLSFQTRSPNGLLFLVGRGKRFLSVELVNGTVVFQYDLGSGPARIATPEPYNDGRWHKVDAVRVARNGRLDVDSNMRGRGESPGSQENLAVSDYMYFGGYPGRHEYPEVSQKGFEGCLDNVNVDDKPVDLTQAKEARYTLVGCPTPQFEQIVATFGGNGYLKIAGDDTSTGPLVSDRDEVFELNFRFRSNDTHGLVFYGANDDQSNFLSVSLAEGLLYVKTEPGSAQVRTDSLNDAQWHMVTVTRDRNKLLVIVDDVSEYSENAGNGPLYLSSAGSQLFFGGRPDDYRMRTDAAVADVAFNGCLGDISINGKRLDFKDAKVKDSTIGQKCLTGVVHEAEDISVSHRAPTIPLEEDSESIDEGEISRGFTRPTTTTMMPGIFDKDDFDKDDFDYIETTSAPTRKPKLMKPTPTPFMECALPYREVPTEEEDVSIEDGVRFGNYEKTSRLEFQTSEGDKSRSEYSIEFKTNSPDGLLFFRSDFVKSDFVALFMKKGILHFAFDSGSGPAILNSTKQLNDSLWHTASFSRHQVQGSLTIDGQIVSTGNSPGSTMDINAGPTLYIGGLPPDAWAKKLTSKKLLNIDSAFRGCLRNFLVKNKSPGVPSVRHSVEPCTEDVEPGFFFYPNGGYLRLGKSFKVGQNIKISLSIRPRHPSGLIMSIHGTRDYVVLQMVNGTVNFTVDNGHGPFSSSFSKGLYDLCDGKWHTILATKTKNVATLAIDGQHAQVGMGRLRSTATDTNHPVYLGGQPTPGAPGVETNEQFVGCIKDFIIHGRPAFKFSYDSIVEGKVALHSCPADGHKSR